MMDTESVKLAQLDTEAKIIGILRRYATALIEKACERALEDGQNDLLRSCVDLTTSLFVRQNKLDQAAATITQDLGTDMKAVKALGFTTIDAFQKIADETGCPEPPPHLAPKNREKE